MLKDELKNSKYADLNMSDDKLLAIIESMKERVLFIKEFISSCEYFYENPTEFDEKVIEKRWKERSPELLKILSNKISDAKDSSKEEFERILHEVAEENEVGMGQLIHPIRLATSGVGIGPGVYDLLSIIGKEEIVARIQYALENISK